MRFVMGVRVLSAVGVLEGERMGERMGERIGGKVRG